MHTYQTKLIVNGKECSVTREQNGIQYLEANAVMEHHYIINDMRDVSRFSQYIYLTQQEADAKWQELLAG